MPDPQTLTPPPTQTPSADPFATLRQTVTQHDPTPTVHPFDALRATINGTAPPPPVEGKLDVSTPQTFSPLTDTGVAMSALHAPKWYEPPSASRLPSAPPDPARTNKFPMMTSQPPEPEAAKAVIDEQLTPANVGMTAGMLALPVVGEGLEGTNILGRLAVRMMLSGLGAAGGEQVGETVAGVPTPGAVGRTTKAFGFGAGGELLGEVGPIAKALKARSVALGGAEGPATAVAKPASIALVDATRPPSVALSDVVPPAERIAGTPATFGATVKSAGKEAVSRTLTKMTGPPTVYPGLEGTPPVDVGAAMEGTGTAGMVRESGPLTTSEGYLRSNIGGNFLTRQVKAAWEKVRGKLASVAESMGPAGTAREAGVSLLAPELETRQLELDAAAADAEAKTAAAKGDADAATAARERATTLRQQIGAQVGPPLTREQAGTIHVQLHQEAEDAAATAAKSAFQEVDADAAPLGKAVQPTALVAAARGVKPDVGALVHTLTPGQAGLVNRTIEATKGRATNPEALAAAQAQLAAYTSAAGGKGIPAGGPTTAAELLASVLGEVGADESGVTPMTFTQAHFARSRFGSIWWRNRDTNPDLALTAAKLKAAIDTDMTTAAGGLDSPLRAKYDAALELHKHLQTTFKEGILATLAEKNAKQAVPFLLSTPDAAQLRDIWRNLAPGAQQAVRQAALNDILHDATGAPRTGRALANRLAKLTPDTRDVLFGPTVGSQLHDLAPLTLGAETAEKTAAESAKPVAAAAARRTAAQTEVDQFHAALRASVEHPEGADAAVTPEKQFASLIGKTTNAVQLAKTKADVIRLRGPEAWAQVQSRWVHDLLDVNKEAALQGTLEGLRPEVVRQMIPDTEMRNTVYRYARVIEHFKKTIPGSSPFVVRSHIAAGLGLIALGHTFGGLATMTAEQGISVVLARVLADPHAGSAFIAGLKASSLGDAPAAAKLALQVAAFLKREGIAGLQSPSGPPSVAPPARAVGAGPLGGAMASQAGPPPSVRGGR